MMKAPWRPTSEDANPCTGSRELSPVSWVLLTLILAAFMLLRLPHIGHLLSFDEAWTSLALRSLIENTESPFRYNFFRHPPLYLLIAEALFRGGQSLAPRLELLSLCINAAAVVALFALGRRLWDTAAGLWIATAYTLMPAAIFYDTWIKRDCLVSLFGVLAILAWTGTRTASAGIATGLAFLGKSTAIFYAQTLGWLALCPRPTAARLRRLAIVAGITVALSAWWYVCLFRGTSAFLGFFGGSTRQSASFAAPWYAYLGTLPHNMGVMGLLVGGVGLLVHLHRAATDASDAGRQALWPLFLLMPALVLVSLSTGKPPWMIVPMLPALATLVGIGARCLHRSALQALRRLQSGAYVRGRPLWPALTAAALVILLYTPFGSYENRFQEQSRAAYNLSAMSRETADAINTYTKPEDRLLITTFSYERQDYCPVFMYYAEPRDVVLRRHETPPDELLRLVREYDLDWLVLSPGQYPATQPLTRQFTRLLGRRPIVLDGAVLFKTDRLDAASQPE